MESTLTMSNFQNSEFVFLFPDPNIDTKNPVRFDLERNFINKTQVLIFLSWNLYGGHPWYVKFQNSDFVFLFLDPNIVINKSAIRFVLR
jgi:hypothetical protein